jgi:hypothetical protein
MQLLVLGVAQQIVLPFLAQPHMYRKQVCFIVTDMAFGFSQPAFRT